MILQNESREHSDERKIRYAVAGAGWIPQEDFMRVLCEKPIVRTKEECREMIEAIETVQSGMIGDPRFFSSIEEALEAGMPRPVMRRSERRLRPCREQIIRLPAVKPDKLVGAAAPAGN